MIGEDRVAESHGIVFGPAEDQIPVWREAGGVLSISLEALKPPCTKVRLRYRDAEGQKCVVAIDIEELRGLILLDDFPGALSLAITLEDS